jgi:hypothetical protein
MVMSGILFTINMVIAALGYLKVERLDYELSTLDKT